MMTYEESVVLANARKPNIDTCTEYKDAYMFTCVEDENCDGGYGHTPIVILKESGKMISMPEFAIHYDATPIQTIQVK